MDPPAQREPRLTSRDLETLAFMAEHQRVLESQIAALVARPVPAVRSRLSDLAKADYIDCSYVLGEPCHTIRRRGLEAIGSDLPVPQRLGLGAYRHDIGCAGLWLLARAGAFGPVAEVLGERRLRSHDESVPAVDELYAVRLGGVTRHGHEDRHYPDLLLIDRLERRLALELELSSKAVARREKILAGYGADRRFDGVVYLVEDTRKGHAIARAVRASAATMGLENRVHIRRVTGLGFERAKGGRGGAGRRPLRSASRPEQGR